MPTVPNATLLLITQDDDNALIGFDYESLATLAGVEAASLTNSFFTSITAVA